MKGDMKPGFEGKDSMRDQANEMLRENKVSGAMAFKKGGQAKKACGGMMKMAMGGAGKMRKGEATKSGKPNMLPVIKRNKSRGL